MLQKLKRLINKLFKKRFVIDFSLSEINKTKIFSNKETFEEFLKMFKNDYVERLGNGDYEGAEVIRNTVQKLLSMYSEYYAEESKDKTQAIDIITKLQDKMKADPSGAGQEV